MLPVNVSLLQKPENSLREASKSLKCFSPAQHNEKLTDLHWRLE